MSVEIKFKKPKQIPICKLNSGEFFYFEDTLYIRAFLDSPLGSYKGIPVGNAAYSYVGILNTTADTLVQPVDVCIEIRC